MMLLRHSVVQNPFLIAPFSRDRKSVQQYTVNVGESFRPAVRIADMK